MQMDFINNKIDDEMEKLLTKIKRSILRIINYSKCCKLIKYVTFSYRANQSNFPPQENKNKRYFILQTEKLPNLIPYALNYMKKRIY